MKLSELAGTIQQVFKTSFSGRTYWIVADVTNHTFKRERGYHYFDLVEKAEGNSSIVARMAGVAWGAGSARIAEFESMTGQQFRNDINVLIRVTVGFHPVYGLQLTLQDIDVNFTLGILEQQRQSVLQRLLTECSDFIRKEGERYITTNNLLSHRSVIQSIAVITSSSSAGFTDFQHTLQNDTNKYRYDVDPYFTLVQGIANAEAVYNKLLEVFKSGKNYDAVVIIRGGGAQTDFLIFDEFILGKIVAKFPIPIITGIGHQKNETIVDLMAHTSTKTPTRAAEFIIAHNRAFEDSVQRFQKSIIIRSQQLLSVNHRSLAGFNAMIVNNSRDYIDEHKANLLQLRQHTADRARAILNEGKMDLMKISAQVITRPSVVLERKTKDISVVVSGLKYFYANYIKTQKGYVAHLASMIKMASPEETLNRGFAMVKVGNKITSNADDLKPGKDFELILGKKQITSTVKSKKNYDGTDFII